MKEIINYLEAYKKSIEQFENAKEISEVFGEFIEINKNLNAIQNYGMWTGYIEEFIVYMINKYKFKTEVKNKYFDSGILLGKNQYVQLLIIRKMLDEYVEIKAMEVQPKDLYQFFSKNWNNLFCKDILVQRVNHCPLMLLLI